MTGARRNNLGAAATYETLYAQLQAVVAQLESGDLPLEDALKLYEQGTQLATRCQRMLDGAELRVQQLQGGSWKLEDDE